MADRSRSPAGFTAGDLAGIVGAAAARSLAHIAQPAGGACHALVPTSIRLRIALRRLPRNAHRAGEARAAPAAFQPAQSTEDADVFAEVLWLAASPDRPLVTLEERPTSGSDHPITHRRDRNG